MERVRERRGTNPLEDPTIVAYDSKGNPIKAGSLAQLFAKRPPEIQEKHAFTCIEKLKIPADLVLSWVPNEGGKAKIKLWCLGKGITFKEAVTENGDHAVSHPLLQQEKELIDALRPHLRQIDLARLVVCERYRDADDDTRQTLVYGTYRLLGNFLGPRRYYRREVEEVPTPLPLPDLPIELFENEFATKILLESEREALLPIFNKDPQAGFEYLDELKHTATNPLHKQFLTKVQNHFVAVKNFSVPGFRTLIAGSQKDVPETQQTKKSPYPSFHQKEFAYNLQRKEIGPVDLLVGDTGTMKTGAVIYALEAVGAKSTLVVCPAFHRDNGNWHREIQEKYEKEVQVVTIRHLSDLKRVLVESTGNPRYTILSYSLLSTLGTPGLQIYLKRLKEKLVIDSIVADEAHLANNPNASCTQQLYLLSELLPRSAPRIAMTASAVVNSVEDLDPQVRFLLPHKFQNEGDFTRAARNDPYLVSALLHGEQIITRWTKKEILGHRLPETSKRDEFVPFSHFHQNLYGFIYLDDTIDGAVKRGVLRQAALDPMLVLKHYNPSSIRDKIGELRSKQNESQSDQDRKILKERINALEQRLEKVSNLIDSSQATNQLCHTHEKFQDWKRSVNVNEIFNEDFLVKIGYEKLALWAFFNYIEGVNEIVKLSNNFSLQADWQGKNGLFSSKYHRLKEIISKYDPIKTKFIIYSGFYQDKVTSGVEELEVDDDLAFLSLFDHLRSWYGDNTVCRIDGSVSIEPKKGEVAKREKVRREWRLNPSVNKLLATLRSCRLGIDLTIPKIEVNRNIEKVVMIFVDPPDTYEHKDQGIGRVEREGQEIPLEVIFMRATNLEQPRNPRYGFIDHGIWEAVDFKQLLSQMTLDAIPLTEDQENFVRQHLANLHIEQYPITPRAYLNNKFFRAVRGKGYESIQKYLQETGFEGMSNLDFFVTYYRQFDEITLPGHNARAVTEIIRNYQKTNQINRPQVASIGAGTGILQATLNQPVTNIDMLPGILRVARERQNTTSDYIAGNAAKLPLRSNSFEITESSLVYHWTNNTPRLSLNGDYTSERVAALQEANRITKNGGLVIFTVPYAYLTPDRFTRWLDIMEKYFGMRQYKGLPSGLIRATDFRPEPISWAFSLEKFVAPSIELPLTVLDGLEFDFERTVDIIDGTRAQNGRGGDHSVLVAPLLPHNEFEIINPSTGTNQKVVYDQPAFTDEEIEDILLGTTKPGLSSIEILTDFGAEGFGLYRRLTKEAKRKWKLTNLDAEELAIKTITFWTENNDQISNLKGFWPHIRSLMDKLHKN